MRTVNAWRAAASMLLVLAAALGAGPDGGAARAALSLCLPGIICPPTEDPPPGFVRVEQDHPAVTYEGNWNPDSRVVHSGDSAVSSATALRRATFRFDGSAVRWIGYRDAYSGKARVYVDGVLRATIDTYALTAQSQ